MDTIELYRLLKIIASKIPIVRFIAKKFYRSLIAPPRPFTTSEEYWKRNYAIGGNSGSGSYNKLAIFKADVLNNFVKENNAKTIIEFGCGDGNQTKLFKFPKYLGFDVSPVVISRCKSMFQSDTKKDFKLIDQYAGEKAELSLSLDVIFHLVEDHVFNKYMERLFDSSNRFVIIYSSNMQNENKSDFDHVKHRKFSDWVEKFRSQWILILQIKNPYPWNENDPDNSSNSDFFIYESKTQNNF